ncbi:hypothetical protein [Limnoglobus roseus]|nr:hypothetical protein [Limnoglobus roseus]
MARSGRTVAVALGVFLLGQVALNAALETVRPEWRDPEFGWRLKAVRKLAGRPLVLALGSSRTQMGLSPHDLGLGDGVIVYNFGEAGSGPLHLLLNLRRVLDAGVKPDAVLVEVMPAVLSHPGAAEDFFHDHVTRLGYADLGRLEPYCDDATTLRNRWLAHRVSPWHAQRFLLLSHWQPGLLPWQARVDFQWRMMDDRGWVPYPFETIPEDHRQRQTADVARQYEQTLREFTLAPLPDRALRDLLALCQERGIAVAMYRMPEGSMFRQWTSPSATATIEGYLAQLSTTTGVPIFDATTWLPDEAFADGHHPLKSGAKRFSARFGRECLNPWLTSCKLTPDP